MIEEQQDLVRDMSESRTTRLDRTVPLPTSTNTRPSTVPDTTPSAWAMSATDARAVLAGTEASALTAVNTALTAVTTLSSDGDSSRSAAIVLPSGAQKKATTEPSSSVRTDPVPACTSRSGPTASPDEVLVGPSGAMNASESPVGSKPMAATPKTGISRR
jgi:hypothetical protein